MKFVENILPIEIKTLFFDEILSLDLEIDLS